MKRIGNSKEPTPKILANIADNLTEKTRLYSNVSVESISIIGIGNLHTDTNVRYGIYIETFKTGTEYYETWPEVLKRYKELMNE